MLVNPMIIWVMVGVIVLVANKMQTKRDLTNIAYAAFMIGFFVLVGVMKTPAPGAPDYSYYYIYIIGQIIVFIVACFVFAFLLRDSAPKSKLGAKAAEYYQSIIGRTTDVAQGGLNSVSGGKVLLDGKLMDAKLAAGSEVSSVKAGTKMIIDEVVGDILVVSVNDD